MTTAEAVAIYEFCQDMVPGLIRECEDWVCPLAVILSGTEYPELCTHITEFRIAIAAYNDPERKRWR